VGFCGGIQNDLEESCGVVLLLARKVYLLQCAIDLDPSSGATRV
jgi:hypothetical protein